MLIPHDRWGRFTGEDITIFLAGSDLFPEANELKHAQQLDITYVPDEYGGTAVEWKLTK